MVLVILNCSTYMYLMNMYIESTTRHHLVYDYVSVSMKTTGDKILETALAKVSIHSQLAQRQHKYQSHRTAIWCVYHMSHCACHALRPCMLLLLSTYCGI